MGLLDGPLRSAASSIIGALGGSARFTRVVEVLDPINDTTSDTTTTASLLISPPEPFNKERIDGTTILTTDLWCFVAAKAVDDASFDLREATGVRLTMTYAGKTYHIVGVDEVRSGDQAALLEVQLRV